MKRSTGIHKIVYAFAALVAIILFTLSVKRFYVITGDLPNLIANARAIKTFSSVAESPYFASGQPDFHAGLHAALVSLMERYRIGYNPIQVNYMAPAATVNTLAAYLAMGIFTICLFFLALYLLSVSWMRRLSSGVIFLILTAFFVEVPLLHWTGSFSIHGMMYGAYFPQFFAIVLVLFLFGALTANLPYYTRLVLALLITYLILVSHPLTGLIAIAIVISFYSLEFRRQPTVIGFLLVLISISWVHIANTWPLVSFYEIVDSIYSYWLISIVFTCLPLIVMAIDILAVSTLAQIPRIESQRIAYAGLLISVISLLVGVFSYQAYFGPENAEYWILSFGPIVTMGIMLIPGVWREDGPTFDRVMALFLLGCLSLFCLGVATELVKVYWRFLLFARLPALILVGRYLGPTYFERKNWRISMGMVLLIIAGGMHLRLSMLQSRQAAFFTKIPPEIRLAKSFPEYGQIILSDPNTSYYLATLTDNRAVIVPIDRVADYEQERVRQNIERVRALFSKPTKGCQFLRQENVTRILVSRVATPEEQIFPADPEIRKEVLARCGFLKVSFGNLYDLYSN